MSKSAKKIGSRLRHHAPRRESADRWVNQRHHIDTRCVAKTVHPQSTSLCFGYIFSVDGHGALANITQTTRMMAYSTECERRCDPNRSCTRAHLPQHVQPSWLARACAIAPVPCTLMQSPDHVWYVVSVFPNAQHSAVHPQEIILKADYIHVEGSLAVNLSCGDADISLNHGGHVATCGEAILSRAAGVHRIQGGSVRINE